MTQTLKKQLTLLCAATVLGGALLWNSGALRAQDEAPKISRDETARYFAAALETPGISLNVGNFIATKSDRELGNGADKLLLLMATQWNQAREVVHVQSEGAGSATVTLEPNPDPPARPLVLVEDKGAWGVDLVETYAKWNNLAGVAKAEAIYKLTGVALVDLPRDEAFRRAQCQSNLKEIALGVAQYMQDYDDKFPLAKGWVDNVKPYLKNEALFTCPGLPKGQKYGYAYNFKLSNKTEEQLAQKSETVEIYETSVLKRNAFGMGENTAFRHLGGANYGFADGHVKWFKQGTTPSFKLKP